MLSVERLESDDVWSFTIRDAAPEERSARFQSRRIDDSLILNEYLSLRWKGEVGIEGFGVEVRLEHADGRPVNLPTVLRSFWSGKESLALNGRLVTLPLAWLAARNSTVRLVPAVAFA